MIHRRVTTGRRMVRSLAVLLIVSLSGACSSITDSSQSRATEARVLITGTSPVPLQLVTSTRFSVTITVDGDELIGLISADTTHVEPPVDRSILFDGSDRFFVMVTNPSTTADASIDMRLLVDGREVLRQPAILRDASIHFTYFVTNF